MMLVFQDVLFSDSSCCCQSCSQMHGFAGGHLRRLQGEEVYVQSITFRAFCPTRLTQQVSDWTGAGAHWGREVDRSRLVKSLIRTCWIQSSCFIVFICLLLNLSHDSLLRFAPQAWHWCQCVCFGEGDWNVFPSFIRVSPRRVQQGKS